MTRHRPCLQALSTMLLPAPTDEMCFGMLQVTRP